MSSSLAPSLASASASASAGDTTWLLPAHKEVDDQRHDVIEATTTTSDTATVKYINYVAFGIIANVIVGVGIVGNLINLIVLTRPKLKGVMYRYLLGLAASNLLVLIMAIPALMKIRGALRSSTFEIAFFQAHLEIPLLNSFMASSVYIIICMTVNRYISIYKPTHFQRIHTYQNAYIAICCSFVGGMLLHIPLAFETKVVSDCHKGECVYSTPSNGAVADHPLYRVYLWISEALLRLGPIITLTILNVLIIIRFQHIALKREVLKGGSNDARGSVCSTNAAAGNDHNGTTGATTSPQRKARLSVDVSRLAVPSSSTATTSTSEHTISTLSSISRATSPAKLVLQRGGNGTATGTTPNHHRRRRGLHSPEERMLVVVLIAIVILFVVCTTPAAFLSILVTEKLKQEPWFAVFRAVANNLELLCFALNFFVYCLCSADIRKAFVDVLFANAAVTYLRRKSFKASTIEMADVNNV